MPSFIFPCEYVYWRNLENHEKLKSKLLPQIEQITHDILKDHNQFSSCRSKGSLFNGDRQKTLEVNKFLTSSEIVKDVVWDTIDMGLEHLEVERGIEPFRPQQSLVSEAWFNVYEKDDFQELHAHIAQPVSENNKIYGSSFSLVYILSDNTKKGNPLVFKKRVLRSNFCGKVDYHEFETANVPEIKEGTVLLFPACLNHYVKPITESGRITIVYNVRSTWDR